MTTERGEQLSFVPPQEPVACRRRHLEDARTETFKKALNGTECELCGQGVKIFRRHIQDRPVKFMVWLVGRYFDAAGRGGSPTDCWWHENGCDLPTGYGTLLARDPWSLIIPDPRVPRMCRPSDRGVAFVRHQVAIPATIRTLGVLPSRTTYVETELTCIRKAMGKDFSARAIMGALMTTTWAKRCEVCR